MISYLRLRLYRISIFYIRPEQEINVTRAEVEFACLPPQIRSLTFSLCDQFYHNQVYD